MQNISEGKEISRAMKDKDQYIRRYCCPQIKLNICNFISRHVLPEAFLMCSEGKTNSTSILTSNDSQLISRPPALPATGLSDLHRQ